MAVVLDTGGLIAFDRGDRALTTLVEATRRRGEGVVTSAGCVAQAWRSGGPHQALLARLLRGVGEAALDRHASRQVGRLCAAARLDDVVDAHVALLVRDGDVVMTSDVVDLRALLRATGVRADVRRC